MNSFSTASTIESAQVLAQQVLAEGRPLEQQENDNGEGDIGSRPEDVVEEGVDPGAGHGHSQELIRHPVPPDENAH